MEAADPPFSGGGDLHIKLYSDSDGVNSEKSSPQGLHSQMAAAAAIGVNEGAGDKIYTGGGYSSLSWSMPQRQYSRQTVVALAAMIEVVGAYIRGEELERQQRSGSPVEAGAV